MKIGALSAIVLYLLRSQIATDPGMQNISIRQLAQKLKCEYPVAHRLPLVN
jgi:hypothetical protein